MSKPMVRIHNTETNEVIDREMNDAEYDQHLKNLEAIAEVKAQAETKAQAKAVAESKLSALGLTTDDLRALGL